jgi:hypothetical protein
MNYLYEETGATVAELFHRIIHDSADTMCGAAGEVLWIIPLVLLRLEAICQERRLQSSSSAEQRPMDLNSAGSWAEKEFSNWAVRSDAAYCKLFFRQDHIDFSGSTWSMRAPVPVGK